MQPLDGVNVLDFTHALAGSACTNTMRRLGADIVKVERPGTGDDLRHYTEHDGLPFLATPFCSVNAGKKSLSLDLKAPEAREVLRRLVMRADIVIENYRPGVPASLGIDYESLAAINPRLVYCTITGFGQQGPLRDRTAYDHIVQAASGIMHMNGNKDGPMKIGLPAVDTFTGYVASIGVLAALRRRDATGRGEYLDISMLDSAMTLMSSSIVRYLHTGRMPEKLAHDRGFRLTPTAGIFETSDGPVAVGANHQHQVEALFAALGLASLLDDARFATNADRIANADALLAVLRDAYARRTSAEIEALLAAVKVPVAKVNTIAEAADHPQTDVRRLYVSATVPGLDDPMRLVRGAPMMQGAGDDAGSVPLLGEHNDEILADLGFSPEEIEALRPALTR